MLNQLLEPLNRLIDAAIAIVEKDFFFLFKLDFDLENSILIWKVF